MAKAALAKLGMQSEPTPRKARRSPASAVVASPGIDEERDYFVEKDGLRFAGTHLLIDLWGARHLDDPRAIEAALRAAAAAARATVLNAHFHHFSPSGGVSGVLVIAESHMSIHTWPERAFAAIDIFMCGTCDPYKAVPVLRRAFAPASIQFGEQRRGLLP